MKVTSLRYLDAKFHYPSPYLPASRTLVKRRTVNNSGIGILCSKNINGRLAFPAVAGTAGLLVFFLPQPLSTSCCKWISVILVRCDLWCLAGQCSGHYFSYFILITLLATFSPIFVCLQTIASCTVLLDLRMTPVSCKMIYLLYLDGQKLGRWGLILSSATYCLSLINVTSLLLFTTLEQTC